MIHICSKESLSSITGVREGDVQPNAVDVRIGKVFSYEPLDKRWPSDKKYFRLYEDEKEHRPSKELLPSPMLHNPERKEWYLRPGSYEISMINTVTIGEGEAGWIVPRSTIVRNGLMLASGIYDSSYSGPCGACLHVFEGVAVIEYGARIGQFILVKAEMLHKYQGSYGFHSNYDQKYLVEGASNAA